MRVSKARAAANRERIVEEAARLFRERGFDGVGVAALMKQAGLTHGGFYGHFDSKEQLMAEACEHAINTAGQGWDEARERHGALSMDTVADRYLSRAHRDHPGAGCVVAALASDAPRQSAPVRAAMTGSVRRLIALVESALPGHRAARKRRQALAATAAMVGGLILARAVDDDALSNEFLQAVAAELPGARASASTQPEANHSKETQ
ncbi:TetR/AcrR family transcriptional regulator [Alloalcanivorax marinus]|uniref:TetR/AcrR family transcriptional regulator n=1 Tax=Alloalcanivorax marinus TaxID=1177169 RepID=UPI001932A871|nr:TetR/AcrR family transcriptional regulator [Alloalcanivorax marinus]MBL7251378.1 TetR/AcrR family transcriptional regulator [Alloalcanivorax marinus]